MESPKEIPVNIDVNVDLTRMRQAMDQMNESVKEWTKIVASYYNSLIENKVPMDLAYRLAQDYQSINLQLIFQQRWYERHEDQ